MTSNDPDPVLVRTRSLLERVGSPYAALRTVREEAGLSLSDLSDGLAVRPAFLEAIESGNLAVLPGSSYAGSLINMYATYLELDGESLVEAAFPAATSEPAVQEPQVTTPVPGPRRIVPGARLVARRPGFTPGASRQVSDDGGAAGLPGGAPEVAAAPSAPASAESSRVALPDALAMPEPPRAPVAAMDAPYAGDPVPSPSTLAMPDRTSGTSVPPGPAVRALKWAALVLFVAAVLAALLLIALVLVRSFEPQTPLGVLVLGLAPLT